MADSKARLLAKLLNTSGNVISSTPSAVSDKANVSTGYLDLPSGTTAQRPGSPDTGVIRFNTTTGKLEMYDTAWLDLDTPPLISSVGYPGTATAASPEGGETITILGSNFCTPTVVKFRNTATGVTTVFAGSVTITGTTQLSFTSPVLPAADYDLLVEANGSTGVFSFGYTANALPGWTTSAGNIGSVAGGAVVSITVVASEPDAGTIAYSVTSGSLPAGLSLTTNVIGGTTTTVSSDTTSTFTMRAIDDEGQIADRVFNIVVKSEYLISKSLRFADADTAYLSRTPSTAGNRKTWTYSAWVKRGNLGITGNAGAIFGSVIVGGSSGSFGLRFDTNDILGISDWHDVELRTSMAFRDPSAWYHIVLAWDTTQAIESNRAKLYVNGSQVTLVEQTSAAGAGWKGYPPQNDERYVNGVYPHSISTASPYGTHWKFDGYLSEVNFIDGQALAPTAFGKVHDVYGHWVPKAYAGSYNYTVGGVTGVNGFYLDFKTSGTLGNDASSGSNNWTSNNLASTDQVIDTPTHNFSTWNPLALATNMGIILQQGNLYNKASTTNAGSPHNSFGTLPVSTGKWYFETRVEGIFGNVGISNTAHVGTTELMNSTSNPLNNPPCDGYGWGLVTANGNKEHLASNIAWHSGGTVANDIVMTAFDMDAGKIWWGVNGTWWESGNPTTGANPAYTGQDFGTAVAFNTTQDGVGMRVNFGADSSFAGTTTAQNKTDSNGIGDFYYTPPTNFNALCSRNLPNPAAVPGEHFNTVTYDGDDSPTRTISGVGFQPSFTWVKDRSNANGHYLWDEVRGTDKNIRSDGTWNETDVSNASGGIVSTSTSDGFITKIGSNVNNVNGAGNSYVAWNWKAGNATLGTGDFTQGTIASTCSRNVDAGFSIVSYTSNGTDGATVGHGLSLAPDMVIVKRRDVAGGWAVYHSGNTTAPETDYLMLDLTSSTSDSASIWYDTAPTPSVFSLGNNAVVNVITGSPYIAYCFHSVDGYSRFGAFNGTGNTDGPMVYTSFRPKYVMIKNTFSVSHWQIHDAERSTYNVMADQLHANATDADGAGSAYYIDFLSNGFKLRMSHAGQNESGRTMIYMAFAENPLKYTNAR